MHAVYVPNTQISTENCHFHSISVSCFLKVVLFISPWYVDISMYFSCRTQFLPLLFFIFSIDFILTTIVCMASIQWKTFKFQMHHFIHIFSFEWFSIYCLVTKSLSKGIRNSTNRIQFKFTDHLGVSFFRCLLSTFKNIEWIFDALCRILQNIIRLQSTIRNNPGAILWFLVYKTETGLPARTIKIIAKSQFNKFFSQ